MVRPLDVVKRHSLRSESEERSSLKIKENSSRTLIKEQFRLPRDCVEKMPSASNSPLSSRKEEACIQKPSSVASMVRRFEHGDKTRGAGLRGSTEILTSSSPTSRGSVVVENSSSGPSSSSSNLTSLTSRSSKNTIKGNKNNEEKQSGQQQLNGQRLGSKGKAFVKFGKMSTEPLPRRKDEEAPISKVSSYQQSLSQKQQQPQSRKCTLHRRRADSNPCSGSLVSQSSSPSSPSSLSSLMMLKNKKDSKESQKTTHKMISSVKNSVSKRSESDGLLVSERPRSEKPFRRCESSENTSKSVNHFSSSSSSSFLSPSSSSSRLFSSNDLPIRSSATIVKGPEDAVLGIGETVIFTAIYFGYPEPLVRWLFNGKPLLTLQPGRVIKTNAGESSLILQNLGPNDGGVYELQIENEIGSDGAFASLRVAGPPEPPPGRPYISDVSFNSLTLAWYGSTFDGGSIIVGYSIEMASRVKDSIYSDWTVLKSGLCSTSYVYKGLLRNNEYVFRVRALNAYGSSSPSLTSEPLSPISHFISETSNLEVNQKNDSRQRRRSSSCSNSNISTSISTSTSNTSKTHVFDSFVFEHRIVSLEEGSTFKRRYAIHEELGRGRFGVVYKVQDKEAHNEVLAAKFIRCKRNEERQKVRDEIEIMNSLNYSKLLHLAAAYETPRDIIMVMEYIGGGELFEKVVADDFTLTERDCVLFMRQICEAIGFMHAQNIVHLDLKPENILCESKNSHDIKIIDFGLTRKLKDSEEVRILFGTPEFVSPEVISYEPVSTTSDMWSVGVICYVLLSGLSPFMGDSDVETFSNISGLFYDFEDEAFESISEEAKDFISKLLVKNPKHRSSSSACLEHIWLSQNELSCKAINTDKLKSFLMRRRWQKAAHAIRALGRFTSLGLYKDKDSSSSFSTESAEF